MDELHGSEAVASVVEEERRKETAESEATMSD